MSFTQILALVIVVLYTTAGSVFANVCVGRFLRRLPADVFTLDAGSFLAFMLLSSALVYLWWPLFLLISWLLPPYPRRAEDPDYLFTDPWLPNHAHRS